MKKSIIIFLAVMIISVFFFVFSSHADFLYSKPEFRGRVIDSETKEPIEGAVVVVLYYKRPLIGSPAGVSSYVFHARETLTDSKGEFYFPSYSSVLLFTEDRGVRFIFYKPGYMAGYGTDNISFTLIESYFSAGKVGEEKEIEGGTFEQGSYIKWKGPLGIVELKRAETREDRRRTRPSIGGIDEKEELPLFFKIVEDEYRYLYGKEER